jgi:hypothetical protein
MPGLDLLDLILAVVAAWLAVGAAGLFALHRFRLVARVLFPLGGVLGLALAGAAGAALFAPPLTTVTPVYASW